MDEKPIHESVKNYYGKVLSKTSDLQTTACCMKAPIPAFMQSALKKVPQEVLDRYFGCGAAFSAADFVGKRVLDLGSGSGRDCYIASALIGESGEVYGVDMTDEPLELSRKHADSYCQQTLGYKKTNLHFLKGYIELLPDLHEQIAPDSLDLVISNCVLNLSPNKEKVLKGVFGLLKEGGEMYFSDMFADRRLPTEAKNNEVLLGEGLSGSLYVQDFIRICRRVGFADPRIVSRSSISVLHPELKKLVGNTKYESITFRLVKLSALEDTQENYGQYAIYKGNCSYSPSSFVFDNRYTFEAQKPQLVSANVAEILMKDVMISKFFEVSERKQHFGSF